MTPDAYALSSMNRVRAIWVALYDRPPFLQFARPDDFKLRHYPRPAPLGDRQKTASNPSWRRDAPTGRGLDHRRPAVQRRRRRRITRVRADHPTSIPGPRRTAEKIELRHGSPPGGDLAPCPSYCRSRAPTGARHVWTSEAMQVPDVRSATGLGDGPAYIGAPFRRSRQDSFAETRRRRASSRTVSMMSGPIRAANTRPHRLSDISWPVQWKFGKPSGTRLRTKIRQKP